MSTSSKNYEALVKTIEILRAPGGCPWDREQTHESLTECLIEECSELIEAIDNMDLEHMEEELGDVLLNVIMQAVIAKEAGHFDIEDVCKTVDEKLIRRHPHVFADEASKVKSADQVTAQWEAIKSGEKKPESQAKTHSRFKPQPPRLPALLFAKKTYKQIQKLELENHPHVPSESIHKMAESMDEDQIAAEIFRLAAVCRVKGLDPERLTRSYTQGLVDRLSG